MRNTLIAVTLFAAVAFVSLTSSAAYANNPQKMKSLYERLGGKKAIEAVVADFVGRAATDPRIKSFFADTASDPKRVEKLKKNLVDQICEASGGPCKYKGKDMKTAHKGMGVTGEAFGALVEDLIATLDKFKVPEAEKNELLSALAPMKSDIVER
jgi:hemoglobin